MTIGGIGIGDSSNSVGRTKNSGRVKAASFRDRRSGVSKNKKTASTPLRSRDSYSVIQRRSPEQQALANKAVNLLSGFRETLKRGGIEEDVGEIPDLRRLVKDLTSGEVDAKKLIGLKDKYQRLEDRVKPKISDMLPHAPDDDSGQYGSSSSSSSSSAAASRPATPGGAQTPPMTPFAGGVDVAPSPVPTPLNLPPISSRPATPGGGIMQQQLVPPQTPAQSVAGGTIVFGGGGGEPPDGPNGPGMNTGAPVAAPVAQPASAGQPSGLLARVWNGTKNLAAITYNFVRENPLTALGGGAVVLGGAYGAYRHFSTPTNTSSSSTDTSSSSTDTDILRGGTYIPQDRMDDIRTRQEPGGALPDRAYYAKQSARSYPNPGERTDVPPSTSTSTTGPTVTGNGTSSRSKQGDF